MSLDALAPDQRAVVQLVLQQDRAYEDLAGLLGITTEAVRERAHRGLERLAPGEAVDPVDRAGIADYLLGQQSVSGREATRALLAGSQPLRSWAQAVAAELEGVASRPLPEIPEGEAVLGPDPRFEPEPAFEPGPPVVADAPLVTGEDVLRADPAVPSSPRHEPAAADDFGFDAPRASEPAVPAPGDTVSAPTSRDRVGGALLIAGLGIFVAALIVWLVTRDDDATPAAPSTPTTSAQATPTATGTPNFEALGTLGLTSATGGQARARLTVFAAPTGDVAFGLKGSDVPPTPSGEEYALWLTGGDEPHFLGFTPRVGADGKLDTIGPRVEDARAFASWLAGAKRMVLSRETQEGATEPGPLVLEGTIDQGAGAAPSP